MRRFVATAVSIAAAVASLTYAGPALADVPAAPAVAGVAIVALLILGAIVIVVVVVSIFVLRGIARSRRETRLREERAAEQQAPDHGEAPPDAPDQGSDGR
jgi:uncharacterized membrane protein